MVHLMQVLMPSDDWLQLLVGRPWNEAGTVGRYENVVKFKIKCAPATFKKCALSVLTISSPPQSHETVPLSTGT